MFWERYEILCKQKGKSPNAFAKEIGAGTSVCTYWKKGAIPKGETLLRIAESFECSIDYLLGRTENPNSHRELPAALSIGNDFNNRGIIGNIGSGNSHISIGGSDFGKYSDEQLEILIDFFTKLDQLGRAELLLKAAEIAKKAKE